MTLQRIRLTEALKKLKLKRPTSSESPKFKLRPPSPTSILSLHGDSSGEFSDDESAYLSKSPTKVPADVAEGFLAVYIGGDDEDGLRRYVIPVNYLKHKVFKVLLRSAEEEFGFSHAGGIRIPCESVLFEHVLWLLNKNDPAVQSLEMEDLLRFYCSDEEDC